MNNFNYLLVYMMHLLHTFFTTVWNLHSLWKLLPSGGKCSREMLSENHSALMKDLIQCLESRWMCTSCFGSIAGSVQAGNNTREHLSVH